MTNEIANLTKDFAYSLYGGVSLSIDICGGNELTFGVLAYQTIRFSALVGDTDTEVGDQIQWMRKQIDDERNTHGMYIVSSVVRKGIRLDIEADIFVRPYLEMPASNFLGSLTYPITHKQLLDKTLIDSLNKFTGGSITEENISSLYSAETELVNGDYSIQKNPAYDGITYGDIIRYLSEASACIFYADPMGQYIHVGSFRETDVALTKANYSRPFIADYTVAPIDRVQIRSSANDIGVIAGDGSNTYVIENNPLFLPQSDAQMRPYAERLAEKLAGFSYVPCEVPLYNDCGLRPGDIFTIDGKASAVMSYRCSESGTVVGAYGSPTRPVQSTVKNRDIIAMMGKTNELTRTVEENTLRIADAEGNVSLLSQTVSGFDARIENAEGKVTTLSATVNGLDTRVSDAEGNVSALGLTVDGLSTRVSDAEGNISTLEQTSSNISARVGQNEVAISNIGIQLTGYVTFSALTTSGQTTINGDNITTGTIKAITLEGCTFKSTNGLGYLMQLDGGALLFKSGSISVAEFGVYDGRAVLGAYNGFVLTFEGNPQIESGGSYYENIHAGNIGSYVSSVYAVFG